MAQCDECQGYLNPALAVDACVRRDDSILLVQRKFPPSAGSWVLPGGFVDQGERPEEAVLRELKEEAGLDGTNPQLLMVMGDRFKGPEDESSALVDHSKHRSYWIWFAVLMAGSLVVLFFLADNLRQLVDLATTLSFVTAPVIAWLNHRAMAEPDVKGEFRLSAGMNVYSLLCVVALSGFSLFFLYFRFVL